MSRDILLSEFEADQVLDEIALLSASQSQIHARVVVIDDRVQVSEAAVVIEATFKVGRNGSDRRCAIAHIGAAISLEAVNANFAGLMKVPAGVAPQRLDVTAVASGLAAEERVSAGSSGFVEFHRWIRRGNRELIELQSGELWGDQIIVGTDVW